MERLTSHDTPPVQHLNPEQLNELREEFAAYEQIGWRYPMVDQFHDLFRDKEWIVHKNLLDAGAVGQFYKSCYPDASTDELWQLAHTDARCLEQIGTARRFSGFDPKGTCYDLDTEKIRQFSLGTPLEDPAVDHMVMVPHSIMKYPALIRRVENGMPRKLQLVYAATAMASVWPGDMADYRDSMAEGLKAICNIWELSADESRFVLEQAARDNHQNESVLNIMMRSDELQQRCLDKDGAFDFEMFGGVETMRKLAISGFERFAKSFRYDGTGDGLWQDIERVVPPKMLEEIYPYEQRKQLVLDEYMTSWAWSYVPHSNAAEYLTKYEAEVLMALKIAERREVPDPGNGNSFKPTVSWVAQLLGASGEMVQTLRDKEIKADYAVLAECSDNPEVKEFVNEQLTAIEAVDEDLLGLLEQYRRACSDNAFHVYIDGHYCGNDPELEREYNEFYRTKSARAERLRAEIVELQTKIAEKLGPEQ